jgi:hypothetical protein
MDAGSSMMKGLASAGALVSANTNAPIALSRPRTLDMTNPTTTRWGEFSTQRLAQSLQFYRSR